MRENRVGAGLGQRRAAPDRDGDLRLCQHWGIIDAVAHGQDHGAVALQRGHISAFALGRHGALRSFHAEIVRPPAHRLDVVARYQMGADAKQIERVEQRRGLRTRDVGQAKPRQQALGSP
ncbi:hypothetical protein D3C85_1564150 [compost metagenome]